jgi:hypothetical protein
LKKICSLKEKIEISPKTMPFSPKRKDPTIEIKDKLDFLTWEEG